MPETTEGQHLLRQVKHLLYFAIVLIVVVAVIVLALQIQVNSRNRDIARVRTATEKIAEINEIVHDFQEAADKARAAGNPEATQRAIQQIAENSKKLDEIQHQLIQLQADLSR